MFNAVAYMKTVLNSLTSNIKSGSLSSNQLPFTQSSGQLR